MPYCTQSDIELQLDEGTLVQLTTDDITEETVNAYIDATSLTLASNAVAGDSAAERLANVQRITVELTADVWTAVVYSAVSAGTPAVITMTAPGGTHTLKDFKARYIPVPVVVAAVVTRAIADADEEIDSYLSVRYALPFSATPNRVRSLSVDIAIYHLYKRRRGAPEARAQAYKDALAFLKDVAKGTANLDVPDPSGDSEDGVGTSSVKTDRVFSRGRSSDSSAGSLDNY